MDQETREGIGPEPALGFDPWTHDDTGCHETASSPSILTDGHQRPINSIRISVNRECNLDCFYCHNEGMPTGKRSMTLQEIEELANLASGLGIRKVKITGGEPLERDDIVEVVGRVSPHFDEVSMTTNAIGLANMAMDLRDAGLARVNISLNSLKRDRYQRISGHDRLDEALEGIDAAIAADLTPLKLNMVLLRKLNEDEVLDLMRFASDKGAILQVIEFEMEREHTASPIFREHHMALDDLREWLLQVGRRNGANPLHNRERFLVEDLPEGRPLSAPVEVELVAPMHNTGFCSNCTRIRLTAGGFVKGCLFDSECVGDLLGPLRDGADKDELEEVVLGVVASRRPYWTGSK
jgi:cyclic pyranopterin phosphate synthase